MKHDALTAARVTLAALPLYAQALAGAAGVRVCLDARINTPKTDGKTIWLPPLALPQHEDDAEAATRLNMLCVGFIAHETGHIRHTDFDAYEVKTEEQKRIHRFVNAIEDPRQEQELIKEYPGTRAQLDKMTEQMIGQPGFYNVLTTDDHPTWLLSAYTLYVLRADLRKQAPFGDLANQSRPALVDVFGERFVTRLDVICATSGMKMRKTADAHAMALDILKAVEEEQEQQRQDQENQANPETGEAQDSCDQGAGGSDGQQDDTGQSDDDAGQSGTDSDDQDDSDASGDDDSNAGGDSGDGQGDDDADATDTGTDAQSGTGDGDGDDDQQDGGGAAGQQGATGDGAGNGPQPQDVIEALQKAMDEAGDNGLDDLGDMVAKEIQKQNDAIEDHGVVGYVQDASVATVNVDADGVPKRPTPNGSFDTNAALLYSGQLRSAMQNDLKGLQRRRCHESVRGTNVNQRTIHRTSSGDRRLFLTVDDRKELNAAIMILLDVSGSMAGARIQLAQQAAFTLAVALNGLTGISTAVGTFPSYDLALRFGEKAMRQSEFFAIGTGGGTPLAEGTLWATRQLARRREDRKILMVITDGQPCNVESARIQLKASEAHGIETMGIGIELPSVSQLFEKHAVIKSIDELTPAMVSMIRGALRSQLLAA